MGDLIKSSKYPSKMDLSLDKIMKTPLNIFRNKIYFEDSSDPKACKRNSYRKGLQHLIVVEANLKNVVFLKIVIFHPFYNEIFENIRKIVLF